MRVLAIVQAWNSADPIRGFIVGSMEKLSERLEELIILTLEQRELPGRPNIRIFSLGKEQLPHWGRRWHYLHHWYRLLPHILEQHKPHVIFTHMSPIFSVLAAPYAMPRRIPIVTWYAHRQVTMTLRLAHHLSARVVTNAKTAYGYRHDKLVIVEQGIDTELFSPADGEPAHPPLLLSVGRLSPIKDLPTLIDAVHLLQGQGYEIHCALIGEALERDRAYTAALRQKVRALALEDTVQFLGSMPYEQVVHWYRRGFAQVNLCPTGALDKAALEAMACGTLSLAANQGFRETMGNYGDWLLFRYGDAEDLGRKLKAVLRLSFEERRNIGLALRRSVVQRHSLARWMDNLVSLFNEVMRRAA
jgi:glycosyltransferase involved in cell wall biosynthesis